MSESIYLIYKHTSPSGKSYIGQTKNYHRRCNEHQTSAGCVSFSNAIQKYTWERFTHEILVEHLTIDEANILEEQLIKDHNTLAPNGYNLTTGGNSRKCSDETKIKLSIARQLQPIRLHTEESKQKISDAKKGTISTKKGVPLSDEQKMKLSIAKKGIPKGPNTEEHNRNISLASIGRVKTPEHLQHISDSRKGQKWKLDPITGKRHYYFPEKTEED